jgi:hypothetical protein
VINSVLSLPVDIPWLNPLSQRRHGGRNGLRTSLSAALALIAGRLRLPAPAGTRIGRRERRFRFLHGVETLSKELTEITG